MLYYLHLPSSEPRQHSLERASIHLGGRRGSEHRTPPWTVITSVLHHWYQCMMTGVKNDQGNVRELKRRKVLMIDPEEMEMFELPEFRVTVLRKLGKLLKKMQRKDSLK